MDFEAETRERLARMEQDSSSVHRRLDNLESLTESIQTIAVEMRELRVGQDSMRRTIEEMNGRVEEVEARPKKHWDVLLAAAITALVTFVATQIFN